MRCTLAKSPRLPLVLAALLLALLAASGCPKHDATLVGRWQELGDETVTEFREDGTFSGGPYTGSYQVLSDSELEIVFDNLKDVKLTMHYWISGDRLRLTFVRSTNMSVLPPDAREPSELRRLP